MVTGEWLLWNTYLAGSHAGLAPATPVTTATFVSGGAPTTYAQVAADPILNAGLPAFFAFPRTDIAGGESTFTERPGSTVFYRSSASGGCGLAGWGYGSGRVMSFSTLVTDAELADPAYRTLFVNAIRWVSAR
jgi:hypothetical protein